MDASRPLARKPVVLVVDDDAETLGILHALLEDEYRVKAAISGEKALAILDAGPAPDIVLLDVVLPGLDGYATLRKIKENPTSGNLPVIFITAKSDPRDEEKGLSLGAVDYITKPVSPAIVLARVRTHLQHKNLRDFLADRNAYLEAEVARRMRDVDKLQDVAMVAMGSLAETRDNDTGRHIRRTQHYVKELALFLRGSTRLGPALRNGALERIFKSAPLHDIGKVGIPDHILLKPGKLTDDEFETMKLHTTIGRNAILNAERIFGEGDNFLATAREIAYSHHERWDGLGYPEGLAGDAIPVSGRLMAVADVYDALISKRVYKEAMSHDEAVRVVASGAGSRFDPEVAAAFQSLSASFRDIAASFADD